MQKTLQARKARIRPQNDGAITIADVIAGNAIRSKVDCCETNRILASIANTCKSAHETLRPSLRLLQERHQNTTLMVRASLRRLNRSTSWSALEDGDVPGQEEARRRKKWEDAMDLIRDTPCDRSALELAFGDNDDLPYVEQLICMGVPCRVRDIIRAIDDNRYAIWEHLLGLSDVDLADADSTCDKSTILNALLAARHRYGSGSADDFFSQFEDKEYPVHVRTRCGWSSLMLAIGNGFHVKMVDGLVEHVRRFKGTQELHNFLTVGTGSSTPMSVALTKRPSIVDFLTDVHGELDPLCTPTLKEYLNTPLHQVDPDSPGMPSTYLELALSSQGHKHVTPTTIQVLLEKGARVTDACLVFLFQKQRTFRNFVDPIFRLLQPHYPDLREAIRRIRTPSGKTLLMVATSTWHAENPVGVLNLLLEDVDDAVTPDFARVRDPQGRNAVDHAFGIGNVQARRIAATYPSILKLAPLVGSCPEAVRLMLKKEATWKDEEGFYAAFRALVSRLDDDDRDHMLWADNEKTAGLKCLKILLELGANPDTPSPQPKNGQRGWTALTLFANRGNLRKVRLALPHSTDQHSKDLALHFAVRRFERGIARLLHAAGADPSAQDVRDGSGKTTLQLAKQQSSFFGGMFGLPVAPPPPTSSSSSP